MADFNMPPGVSVNMIPGNRPEDEAEEMFFDELDTKFEDEYPKEAKILFDMIEGTNGLDDIIMHYAGVARHLGYERGFQDSVHEDELAGAFEQEHDANS